MSLLLSRSLNPNEYIGRLLDVLKRLKRHRKPIAYYSVKSFLPYHFRLGVSRGIETKNPCCTLDQDRFDLLDCNRAFEQSAETGHAFVGDAAGNNRAEMREIG